MSNFAKHDGELRSQVDELLAQAHAFVEDWLARALPARDAPPRRLHGAMHEAVFPGGRRLRPILCRLVVDLHRNRECELVGRFAAALELVHCASLVQNDLPCFGDASTRRGLPAGHVAHGQATAILVGDALLTLAFELLAGAPPPDAPVAFRLMGLLAAATGGPHGVIGGRALELEPHLVGLELHRRQKSAALFRAAAAGGAIIGGAEGDLPRWARVGELIGVALGVRADRDKCARILATVRELLGPPTLESEALQRLLLSAR